MELTAKEMVVGAALLLFALATIVIAVVNHANKTSKQQNTHLTLGCLNFHYRAWAIPFQGLSVTA